MLIETIDLYVLYFMLDFHRIFTYNENIVIIVCAKISFFVYNSLVR